MAKRPNRTREIAAELRASILAGDYPPGVPLPSRAELTERFHVSPMTARNAVEILRAEGLVELKRGSGVYARAQRPMLRSARNRLSRAERAAGRGAFTTDAHTGGWTPRCEVTVRTEPATDTLADQLVIDPGEELLVRDRTMSAGFEVVQLATSYLPAAIATPEMHEEDSGPGGIYARLEEAGHELDRFEETVRIGQAAVEEAETFGVAAGTAVFRLTRRAFTIERVVEVNNITMLGDRFTLVYDLPADREAAAADPDPVVELRTAVTADDEANRRAAEAGQRLTTAVRAARAAGQSWADIGALTGMSRQAAHERWREP